MKQVLLGLVAIVIGLATFFTVTTITEAAGHVIYPIRVDADVRDPGAIRAANAKPPAAAYVCVLAAWAAGALVGAMVAALLAPVQERMFGLAIGPLGMLVAIINMLMIPYPAWAWAIALGEFLPAAYLGARLGAPTPRESSEPQ